MSPADQSAVYIAALQDLQRRAEAMAQGDLSPLGQLVSVLPAVEDLRRALDVLGAHTEQGLRSQHAYIAAIVIGN